MGEVDESLKASLMDVQRGRETLVDQQHLRRGGGGGTSGGVTDDWKASIDRQLTQLHGDVRALLYGLIGGFLFLIAAGATIYVNLAGQISGTQKDLASLQVESAKTNAKLDTLLARSAPLAK